MPFNTDYSSFRVAVPAHIDWAGYTVTQIDDLIAVAERKVFRSLRTRAMEFSFSINVASDGTASVPSDYVEMKFARMNANPQKRLERKSLEFIYARYGDRSDTGNQIYFAREAGSFIFGPAGASGDVMKGVYYRNTFMNASTIHSIFSAHPDIFLMAAASEATPYIGADARIAVWEQKFQQLVAIANQEAKDEDQSGSTLAGALR